mmetsp:Transcript_21885/g.57805  ORF Transcript_21885/g.57805 Transcript_21885/m.57805 type:complete len:271 (+) Transcript_21885:12-824(+)
MAGPWQESRPIHRRGARLSKSRKSTFTPAASTSHFGSASPIGELGGSIREAARPSLLRSSSSPLPTVRAFVHVPLHGGLGGGHEWDLGEGLEGAAHPRTSLLAVAHHGFHLLAARHAVLLPRGCLLAELQVLLQQLRDPVLVDLGLGTQCLGDHLVRDLLSEVLEGTRHQTSIPPACRTCGPLASRARRARALRPLPRPCARRGAPVAAAGGGPLRVLLFGPGRHGALHASQTAEGHRSAGGDAADAEGRRHRRHWAGLRARPTRTGRSG